MQVMFGDSGPRYDCGLGERVTEEILHNTACAYSEMESSTISTGESP